MLRKVEQTPDTLPHRVQTFQSIFNDPAKLVSMIATVTGLAEYEVLQQILQENRNLGSSVWRELHDREIAPYVWSDKFVDFYQSTTAFIFESLVWNRSSLKQHLRNWITDFIEREFQRPSRLLVFGDGLGFDSAWLARAGHYVSYFEVSNTALGFAQQLFDHYRCEVEMLTESAQIQTGDYDAVVCLDVLEHVPSPNETVRLLNSALSPDGRLIVHAPFWYLAPSVGTHLAKNRRFSGDTRCLYRAHGLRPVDASLFWDPIAFAKITTQRYPSWQARLRIALGGGLLGVGRYWSTPHVMLVKRMLARSLGPWPELESLAEGAAR